MTLVAAVGVRTNFEAAAGVIVTAEDVPEWGPSLAVSVWLPAAVIVTGIDSVL